MRILLTGANGYVGRRLLPELLSQGHQVVCCVRDQNRLGLDKAMLDAVKTSGQRLSATELLEGQAPEARPKQTKKLRDAIKQNYQVLREKGRDIILPRPGKEHNHGRTI